MGRMNRDKTKGSISSLHLRASCSAEIPGLALVGQTFLSAFVFASFVFQLSQHPPPAPQRPAPSPARKRTRMSRPRPPRVGEGGGEGLPPLEPPLAATDARKTFRKHS